MGICVFDPDLDPVVEICEWTGTTCVLPPMAQYTTESGFGGETVTVSTTDEHYHVNWHTNEFSLDDQKTYRIRVSVAGTDLGHADVDAVSTGKELKNVDTNEYIALKDGRTLPIKFRIEEGAAIVTDVNVTLPSGYDPADLQIASSPEPIPQL